MSQLCMMLAGHLSVSPRHFFRLGWYVFFWNREVEKDFPRNLVQNVNITVGDLPSAFLKRAGDSPILKWAGEVLAFCVRLGDSNFAQISFSTAKWKH